MKPIDTNSGVPLHPVGNYLNALRQMETTFQNCGTMASGKLQPEEEKALNSRL